MIYIYITCFFDIHITYQLKKILYIFCFFFSEKNTEQHAWIYTRQNNEKKHPFPVSYMVATPKKQTSTPQKECYIVQQVKPYRLGVMKASSKVSRISSKTNSSFVN